MIRARLEALDNGKPGILLGLSRENIRRLVDEKQPILATGASVGVPDIDSIVICFGETELDLVDELREAGLIPSEVVLHVETTTPPGVTP